MENLPGQGRVRNVSAELRGTVKRLRREMTPAEQTLWNALRNQQLDDLRFRRQHAVGTFILDFYCPAQRLALEVDGAIHDNPEVVEHDQLRQAVIEAYGIKILRIPNHAIEHDLSGVLSLIRAAAVLAE